MFPNCWKILAEASTKAGGIFGGIAKLWGKKKLVEILRGKKDGGLAGCRS